MNNHELLVVRLYRTKCGYEPVSTTRSLCSCVCLRLVSQFVTTDREQEVATIDNCFFFQYFAAAEDCY